MCATRWPRRAPSEIASPAVLTFTAAVAVFCSARWSGFSPPLTYDRLIHGTRGCAGAGSPSNRISPPPRNPARTSKRGRRLEDRGQATDIAAQYVAPRTCTVVDDPGSQRDGDRQAPLTDYADAAAYVLIAEPGLGRRPPSRPRRPDSRPYASPSATSSGSTSRSGATQRCSLTALTNRARALWKSGRHSTAL